MQKNKKKKKKRTYKDEQIIKLSPKHKLFCELYLKYLLQNYKGAGEKAATEAGYSEKTAFVQASRLLSYAKIKEYISERSKKLLEHTQIEQLRVLSEIKNLAFFNISDIADFDGAEMKFKSWDDLPRELTACVSSVKKKIRYFSDGEREETHELKTYDKKGALSDLVKIMGMLAPEKHEHSGEVGVKIVDDI